MIYIHKMENALSSNLALSALFAFRSLSKRNIMAC